MLIVPNTFVNIITVIFYDTKMNLIFSKFGFLTFKSITDMNISENIIIALLLPGPETASFSGKKNLARKI